MNATTPEPPRSQAFHLQMSQEIDESVLESMLKKAGIPLRVLRTVTPLHEGIAFTHLLAEGEWDQSTGAADCEGQCQDRSPRHVPVPGPLQAPAGRVSLRPRPGPRLLPQQPLLPDRRRLPGAGRRRRPTLR